MTLNELRTHALNEYYPALALERLWLRRKGRYASKYLRIGWGVFLVLFVFGYGLRKTSNFAWLEPLVPRLAGLFFVTFGAWMLVSAVRAFYASYYYKSMPVGRGARPPLSFELARILYQTPDDALRGFIVSDEGYTILLRSGMSEEEIVALLDAPEEKRDMELPDGGDGYISATEYAGALFDSYPHFAQSLFKLGIQKKEFLAVADWVIEREIAERAHMRWWVRERLGRVPGLGKDWSYGQIHNLEKYARAIPDIENDEYETHDVYGTKELGLLESILAKNREANALVVGNDNEGSEHIVARLKHLVETGKAMPQLEHKRMIMLDADLVTASAKTKGDFEALLMSILTESYNAGNVLLVFSDFPSFILSAEALGSDLVSLLDQYLTSTELQIIALSDKDRFHAKIEKNNALMERFELVLVEDVDEMNTIKILENEIVFLEAESKVFFTYQALLAVADSADRFFPDGVMPDKAVDLLYEIAPRAVSLGKRIITKDDVLALVKTKTGIPVGKVNEEERDKLLHLEDILHHRVVGQDQAVIAISNAVRRARSGLNNPNRPLASFLFLGPTGVGKTETTKALAEVFFGQETVIERLDMSEYTGAEALPKLIGSFEDGKEGVLASMLREHPYGVLLLDEFEKTSPEVMNLFLQVLDEGYFSDMSGKKVNARNLLIIATSNAGSDLMWEALRNGEDPSQFKDLVVDSIIKAHVMKPELVNRFDGVIVFHPLGKEHLEKISRLQLEKFSTRLADRGIKLVVNDDLVHYLMRYGADPKFGARPMNRALQDTIEHVIADKMIRGDIAPGSEVVLTDKDLPSVN